MNWFAWWIQSQHPSTFSPSWHQEKLSTSVNTLKLQEMLSSMTIKLLKINILYWCHAIKRDTISFSLCSPRRSLQLTVTMTVTELSSFRRPITTTRVKNSRSKKYQWTPRNITYTLSAKRWLTSAKQRARMMLNSFNGNSTDSLTKFGK